MLNARDGTYKICFLTWYHKSLFFVWFCVNRSYLIRVFPQRFFFKEYAAPATEAFVWPSFHFHNFTQRFFLFWLAQLEGRRSTGRDVAGSNPGRTKTEKITEKKVQPLYKWHLQKVRLSSLLGRKAVGPSHSCAVTYLVLVGRKSTHTTVRKEQGTL